MKAPTGSERATWRAKIRTAHLDAQGLCRRCSKQPRSPGVTTCEGCRTKFNQLERGRHRSKAGRTTAAEICWCGECLAAGFHRSGCEVAP